MRKVIITSLLFVFACMSVANAQKECPEEWQAYTNDKYFSNLQPGENEDFKAEDDFLGNLETNAISHIAKSVKTAVHNMIALQSSSLDEAAVVSYFESSRRNADVGMKLIETKRFYNNYTHHGCAIAYIDKSVASDYYYNEICTSQKHVQDVIAIVDGQIQRGHMDSARIELEKIVPVMTASANAIFLLKVFNCKQESIDKVRDVHNELHQAVKDKFKTIGPKLKVALDFNMDLFGSSHWYVQEEIKDWLASRGIGYTNDKKIADWVFVVKSSARKYNTMSNGTKTTYYSYVDADVTLAKTGQDPVYVKKLSEKGAATKNFEEAAVAGYNELLNKLLNVMEENLK